MAGSAAECYTVSKRTRKQGDVADTFVATLQAAWSSLVYRHPDKQSVVVSVLSAKPGGGATTAAVALAKTFAEGGSRTALVSMAPVQDHDDDVPGPIEAPMDGPALERADLPGVAFLPFGDRLHAAGTPLSAPLFATYVSRLASEYEVIIVDGTSEQRLPMVAHATFADEVFLVSQPGVAKQTVKSSLEQIRRARHANVVHIFNKAIRRDPGVIT